MDGKLSNVRVVKSPGLGLDKPVLETLKKWKSNEQKHHRPNKKAVKNQAERWSLSSKLFMGDS
jgi:outer membrane biosynthesis protein TonB